MYDSVFRHVIAVAFSQEELLSATLDAFFVGCSARRLTIFFPQLRAVKAGDKKSHRVNDRPRESVECANENVTSQLHTFSR